MKYTIQLFRTESKQVEIFADSPHQAYIDALKNNPGFNAGAMSELIEDPEEPGTEMEGEEFSCVEICEFCEKPILAGDQYFLFGGEDMLSGCLECGGADGSHKPQIAE